jgi:hypothetical protein
VEAAEAAHAWAVAEARGRLRSVLTPGSGELKAGLGLLRLHATVLETPSGRLPAAGLAAYADTAGELWRQHRNPLVDLILLETPEAESFLTALTEGGSALLRGGRRRARPRGRSRQAGTRSQGSQGRERA